MEKKSVLDFLRFGAYISFLCIAGSLILDYEFTDPILISFPLFLSGFSPVLKEKESALLIYPLFVNVILWLPITKVYRSICGILWVEKWKAFFLIMQYICYSAISFIFLPMEFRGSMWGLLISIIYYVCMRCSIKSLKKGTLFKNEKTNESIGGKGKSLVAVITIHIIAFFSLVAQSQMGNYNVQEMDREIKIPEADIQDISDNGENILYLTSQPNLSSRGRKKYDVNVLNLENGFIWRRNGVEDGNCFKFSKDDKYVFIDAFDENKLEVYNLKTGDIVKEFDFKERRPSLLGNIELSKDDLFFSNAGRISVIWKYDNGERTAIYEDPKGYYELIWMNQNSYILFRKHEYVMDFFFQTGIEVKWNKILENGNIREELKEKIALDIRYNRNEVGVGNTFIRDIDEENICTVVAGRDPNGILNRVSYIDFWDVKNEKKLFSLCTGTEIIDIVFLPKKNQFIVIERMKNDDVRVGFWNLEEREKERNVFLRGIENNRKRKEIKVIKEGKEICELSSKAKIWKID